MLILGGILFALIIAEVGARFATSGLADAPPVAQWEALGEVPTDFASVRTIMDVLRPDSSEVFEGVVYRFNRNGVRGGPRTPRAQPGVFRILVTGDSVTMGHGVPEEETYAALLEQRLNLSAAAVRFEVINLGLSNNNLAATVERLKRLGLPLAPDLIVYGFTPNDIEGPAYRRTTLGPEGQAYHASFRRFAESPSHLLRAVWPRWVSLHSTIWPPLGSYQHELLENYFRNREARRSFDEALDELDQLGDGLGICVHVLIHTHLYYLNGLHPFQQIYDDVGGAAARRGLSVTPTLPYFEGLPASRLWVNALDPHPNAEAHAILARALYEGLLGLPPSCWHAHGRDGD